MTKKLSRNYNTDHDDDYVDRYENGYYDEVKERRRLKRMKNAMRARNVDDLLDLDEDY